MSVKEDPALLLSYSNKGLELFPAQAFVYLMNAKALNSQRKYNEAIDKLQNGIDFVIDDTSLEADFYNELAVGYDGLGKKKRGNKKTKTKR